MSTFLYREGAPSYVVRSNYARDPHARGGSAAWSYSAAGAVVDSTFETGSDTPDGAPGFRRHTIVTASDTASSSGPYYREDGGIALEAGDPFTVSMYLRSSQAGLSYGPQVVLRAGGANSSTSALGDPVALEPWVWAHLSVTLTAPGTFDGFQFWCREATAGSPAAGATLDATMILPDAAGYVRPYFDGSTPAIDDKLHAWTGTPDASTSTESEVAGALSPDLVINYEHERSTGVTAHETITGGPPVIVRLSAQRAQRGTFEFYCATEQLALDVAAMCDGTTNVMLVSDDVPGAPYTFCPLDNVRTRWNVGYRSWVVSVPYVRLTW